jgi:hypothetical protein
VLYRAVAKNSRQPHRVFAKLLAFQASARRPITARTDSIVLVKLKLFYNLEALTVKSCLKSRFSHMAL